jgi:hypothetical protein
MAQSPSWEANPLSASQEIPRSVEPKDSLPLSQMPATWALSQLDIVYASTSHFLKIHLNIILPSTPGSSKWSISFRFPHQNPVYASPLPYTYIVKKYSHRKFKKCNQTYMNKES